MRCVSAVVSSVFSGLATGCACLLTEAEEGSFEQIAFSIGVVASTSFAASAVSAAVKVSENGTLREYSKEVFLGAAELFSISGAVIYGAILGAGVGVHFKLQVDASARFSDGTS